MVSWKRPDRSLILASASPRRREILALMGFEFEVVAPRLSDESSHIDPSRLEASLAALACAKARVVAAERNDALVLGADTVVVCDHQVLGKPRDRPDGRAMLRKLAGRTHDVYTGVSLVCRECGFVQSTTVRTMVRFGGVSEEEIEDYLDTGEYADKAGAYAIQGKAMAFIEGIDGCYYNVVGLPARGTLALFGKFAERKGSLHD